MSEVFIGSVVVIKMESQAARLRASRQKNWQWCWTLDTWGVSKKNWSSSIIKNYLSDFVEQHSCVILSEREEQKGNDSCSMRKHNKHFQNKLFSTGSRSIQKASPAPAAFARACVRVRLVVCKSCGLLAVSCSVWRLPQRFWMLNLPNMSRQMSHSAETSPASADSSMRMCLSECLCVCARMCLCVCDVQKQSVKTPLSVPLTSLQRICVPVCEWVHMRTTDVNEYGFRVLSFTCRTKIRLYSLCSIGPMSYNNTLTLTHLT